MTCPPVSRSAAPAEETAAAMVRKVWPASAWAAVAVGPEVSRDSAAPGHVASAEREVPERTPAAAAMAAMGGMAAPAAMAPMAERALIPVPVAWRAWVVPVVLAGAAGAK